MDYGPAFVLKAGIAVEAGNIKTMLLRRGLFVSFYIYSEVSAGRNPNQGTYT